MMSCFKKGKRRAIEMARLNWMKERTRASRVENAAFTRILVINRCIKTRSSPDVVNLLIQLVDFSVLLFDFRPVFLDASLRV